ncbi:MAG: GAF domain-containing protein [Firmicutes bacterium]|nr:GAF domain-containing protein [Bacillota bacterium]
MSINDRNTAIEDLVGLDLDFSDEDEKFWQKTFTQLVKGNLDIGHEMQQILSGILEPFLVIFKAKTGIILLRSNEGTDFIEVTSNGFIREQPIVIRKNTNVEKALFKYLPKDVISDSRCFTIITLDDKGSNLGVLALYGDKRLKSDPATRSLLDALKNHISDGISRIHYLDTTKRRDIVTKASLMHLGKAMGSTLDLKRLTRQITQAGIAIAEADLCDILLVRGGCLEFQVASGHNKILKGFGNVPLKDDPAASIVKNKNPLLIKNVRSKSRFHDRPWINQKQFKSYVGVPIKQDEQVIGVLEAFSARPSRFSNDDLKLLQSLAGPVAAALKNIKLFEETKKKAEELRILHTHISQIVAEMDIGKMMEEIVNAAREAVGSLMAAAALYDPKTGRFEYRTSNIDPTLGVPAQSENPADKFSYNVKAYAQILRTGKPLRLDDIRLLEGGGIEKPGNLPLRGFLGVPLIDQNKKPCGLVMASLKKDGSLFTEADEEVLTTLANQASIAIQNAQLYRQLEYRVKGLKNLFSVSQKISSSHDSKKIQKTVVAAISKFFNTKMVGIALCDALGNELRITEFLADNDINIAGKKLVFDKAGKARIFKGKKPLLITSVNGRLRLNDEQCSKYFDSFLGIPLIVQNRVIGILGLSSDWTRDRARFEEEIELLQIFANQIAISIDNSRLYEEALSKAEKLAMILEVSKIIASEVDLESIFKQIGKALKKLFGIKHGAIFLSDRSDETLELAYKWGISFSVIKEKRIPVTNNTLIGKAYRSRAPIIIDNLEEHDESLTPLIKIGEPLRSRVLIPLLVKGKACGIITLYSKEPRFFNEERLSIINIFVNQFAIAIRNNQLYTRVTEEKVARREAELSVELLEEKAKSAVVLERTREGVFVVDPDFRIQLFNPALEKITGKSVDKAIGRKCYEVFKDVYVDGPPCDICPMHGKNGHMEKIKANIRSRNGDLKFVEINHSLIDPNEKRGVIGSIRDITKDHELETYHHDLRIATEVQKNILPRVRPEVAGLDIGFMCKPAKQIGGDYFDFIPLDKGKVGIAIGDVSGKSLPAALLVSMHKYILRSAAANTDSVISPLRALNQILWEDTSPEVFVTTIYGVYNPATANFVYANAGHLPPLYFSNGVTKYLWSPQTPLGIQQNLFIEQQQVKLRKGDILVLLSDGVTDMRNSRGDCYGFERLRRLVKKFAHLGSQELANLIFEQTVRFSTGDMIDDFTIVVLKCIKDIDEAPVKELVISNKPIAVTDARRFVAEALRETPISKADSSDILIAVCEAVTNCVLHGQSPDGEDNNIRVSCGLEHGYFKVTISDKGIGYNPNLTEWRPPDLIRDRGRGIYLMQQLMDEVQFIQGDRGVIVVLKKKVHS